MKQCLVYLSVTGIILTVVGGVLNNNIELKEKVNFVHNGTEWLFDPTVTKSLDVYKRQGILCP